MTVTIETGFRETLTGSCCGLLEEGGWNINVMRQNKRKVPLGKSCVLTTR